MDAFYSLEEQEKIILENQKLVYYLVKKFNVVPDNYEDFVSVGTIGLIKAVATFDASKDIKFANLCCAVHRKRDSYVYEKGKETF